MFESLVAWIFRIFRHNWVTVILFSILVSALVYGVQEANWVRDESMLSTALLLGIGFGWLLARSRFHAWVALPYGLVISFLIAFEATGRILPALNDFFSHPFVDVIQQMNLRIVAFSLRLAGWVETLRAGQNVEDPGLFILILGTTLAFSGVWLVWSMVRGRNMLLGLLPVGVLFAINTHLSRQPLTNYMIFLFSGLLLVTRTEFNRQHEEWQRRQVDYPEQLGLEWGGVSLALVLIIVMIARLAPFLGTMEGWRAISEWVNRAHEQTNTTATRLFSGVNPPPPDPAAKPQVYVNTPNMSRIGAPIPQGTETIMWVRTSDPPPPPPEMGMNAPPVITHVHYWRSSIFSTYNGRGWEPAKLGAQIQSEGDEPSGSPPPGRYYLRQNFQMEALNKGDLFATSDPVLTGRGVTLREVIPDGSKLLEGKASEYQVISAVTKVSANQLAAASVDYPPDIRQEYLQLPDTLPERVRTLTGRIVGGSDNPYQRAIKIQNYLRENFQYDLTVREPPEKRDVVDYFLFDAQAGFCSHYATAMTVMLRVVGVPARVATGYAMGSYDQERGAYRVPESAAHAWVEVYFPGYGWIEFEPTVSRNPIVYTEEPSQAVEVPQTVQLEPETNPEVPPYIIGLVLVAMLALVVLPFLLLQMFSTTRKSRAIQVDVLYRRMRRALAWAGMGAVGSVTPDEYLLLYGDQLENYESLQQALRQATMLYRESVYSPHAPDARRVSSASLLWQQSFREWLLLWLKVNWQQLRSRFRED